MIGAGTLLYQATGNSAYLYQARQTARAALAYFTPERLGAKIPFFPSVYFRNLLYLDSVTHDPPGPKLAQAYVNYAWQNLRLSDDLFVAGSPASAQLLVAGRDRADLRAAVLASEHLLLGARRSVLASGRCRERAGSAPQGSYF